MMDTSAKKTDSELQILLVYLKSTHYSDWNPLSIEALAGHIIGVSKSKVKVILFEIDSLKQTEEFSEQIERSNIIGFSISPYTLGLYKDILGKIDFTNKVILLGNQLPTYFPDKCLRLTAENSNANTNSIIVVCGEGEKTLEKIIYNYKDGMIIDKESINNICYIEGDQIKKNKISLEDIKGLEYPPAYRFSNKKNMQMQLSRGCPWGNCIYCTRKSHRLGNKWESFSEDRILKDLNEVILNKGATNIEFCDDEFFGGTEKIFIDRAYKIAEHIDTLSKIKGQKVIYRVFTRPDFIAGHIKSREPIKQLLFYMKTTGLTRICMGIESGCNTQLRRYNRGLNVDTIKEAMKTLREVGIELDCGFILFDPELKLEEIIENVNFYREMNLVESNQWFWRPLVANIGSTIGNKIYQKTKQCDFESMSVKYNFEDAVISELHSIIDAKSEESRGLFFTLKQISKKDYNYEDKTKYNYVAHELVKKNGMIYVDMLEQITLLIIKARNESEKWIDFAINNCFETHDIYNEVSNDNGEILRSKENTIIEHVNNICNIEKDKNQKLYGSFKKENGYDFSNVDLLVKRDKIFNDLKDNMLRTINIADMSINTLVEDIKVKCLLELFEERDKQVLLDNIQQFENNKKEKTYE